VRPEKESTNARCARYSVLAICVLAFLAAFPGFGQTYQETFEHARSLLKQNQFAEALEQARLAVKLDSTRWEGWYVAGTAAVGLEKTDLAIDYFQEALSRAPDAAKPTVNNAITACRQALASKAAASVAPVGTLPNNGQPSVAVIGTVWNNGNPICTGFLRFQNGRVTFTIRDSASYINEGGVIRGTTKPENRSTCAAFEFDVPRSEITSYGPRKGFDSNWLGCKFHVMTSSKGDVKYVEPFATPQMAGCPNEGAFMKALDATRLGK
jgi:Tetratricopeptide repeat